MLIESEQTQRVKLKRTLWLCTKPVGNVCVAITPALQWDPCPQPCRNRAPGVLVCVNDVPHCKVLSFLWLRVKSLSCAALLWDSCEWFLEAVITCQSAWWCWEVGGCSANFFTAPFALYLWWDFSISWTNSFQGLCHSWLTTHVLQFPQLTPHHIVDLYLLPVGDLRCPLQVRGHTFGQIS